MAIEEQTMFRSFQESIVSIFCYIMYALKLYVIGIVALLSQLLGKSAPVRGLCSQEGQTAIVTGGASGIGLHLTRQLASLGAHVVIACRTKEEADRAIGAIRQECPKAKVQFMELDLASFSSVRKFVADFKAMGLPLHILINNGGIMLAPFQETQDGYERHLQVNHLSHALLTSLLTNTLEASSLGTGGAARVINVSSVVHHVASLDINRFTERQHDDWSYSPHNAYAASKLAILLYSYALARRWAAKGSKVTVNVVHPGVVNTSLYRHVHWTIRWGMDILRRYLFMNPEVSALTVVHVATSPQLEGVSGCYFSLGGPAISSPQSHMPSLQETVFLTTQQATGVKAA